MTICDMCHGEYSSVVLRTIEMRGLGEIKSLLHKELCDSCASRVILNLQGVLSQFDYTPPEVKR